MNKIIDEVVSEKALKSQSLKRKPPLNLKELYAGSPPINGKANGHAQQPSLGQKTPIHWVTRNTAMIIVHGIGEQLPLETLDMFGRGLVSEYANAFGNQISIQHCVVTKQSDSDECWFDNVVRITKEGSKHHIDLYEYYWANYTEDKASWTDISMWLDGVVKGAKEFYDEQPKLGETYNDSSIFFDKNGKFRPIVYKIFIGSVSKAIIATNLLLATILKFMSYIPLVGGLAATLLKSLLNKSGHRFANILGDICVYNVVDPKSKFYCVRRQILDGAVSAIRYLLEKKGADKKRTYASVVVAGHSLGSQISYDAINKVNLLANQGLIDGYDCDGKCLATDKDADIARLSDQLTAYITFGSPLDKIVFFLREKTGKEQKLRQQMMEAYHCFKQLQWSTSQIDAEYMKLKMCIHRFLDDIPWRNYYDDKDYVSGRLDYYGNVDNINCQFDAPGKFAFTHSDYWSEPKMYRDIILNLLK
jgi:hypothetical protein